MNCHAARELLLVADPIDIEGGTESELSRHLRDCELCRRAARMVLDALTELEAGLCTTRSDAAEAAARRALVEARKRQTRSQWVRRAVPLAAAAGLAAALLFVRRGPPLPPVTAPTRAPIYDVTVTAPPGRNLAVLHTGNPDIVVVWFF